MISFYKMQATGNDFIIINCISQQFRFSYSNLARYFCNRKYGIGADGVIFIEKSEIAVCKMRIFNQDGTEAGMCGNGIRCLAKYVYEEGITDNKIFEIETLTGIKKIEVIVEGKTVTYISVYMGNPILEYNKIPVIFPNVMQKELECLKLNVCNNEICGYPVSMGNPHCVVFVDSLEKINVEEYGKTIENYKYFPNKTNVEFVKIINKNKIRMLVWERGVGRTLGCGTGACACAVISALKEFTYSEVLVELEGGSVKVSYNNADNFVVLSGSAEKVFEGKIDI